MIPIELAVQVGGLIVSAVILVVGLKYALNGMRGDITEIKSDMKTLVGSDAKQNERHAATETEVENTKGWVRRIETGLGELRQVVGMRGETR